MSEDKRYIVKGSIINSLGMITNVASPLLTILLARFFSQEEYGLFIALQLLVLTVSRFFILGLDKGLGWFIPQNQRLKRAEDYGLYEALNVSLLFGVLGSMIASVAILFGGLDIFPTLTQLPKSVIILCICNIVPCMVLSIGANAFEGVRKPQYKILINKFVVMSLFPLFAIACYYLGCGTYSMALGFTIANCIGALWYMQLLQKRFSKWHISFSIPKELINYSLPLTLSDVIVGLLLRVDIWMVLALLGPKSSAIYSIMVVLSNGVKAIRQNFDSLIVTVVSKMGSTQIDNELKSVFSYTTNIVTFIQLAVAFAILYIPKEILMIAGKDYSVAPKALSILLIGNLCNGLLGANGLVLLGIGKTKLILFINIFSLLVNIAGNVILIPQFGIAGAALASVFAIFLQNTLNFAFLFLITKKQFYEKHILINAGMILFFSYVVFRYFDVIQLFSIENRFIYLGLSLVMCGVLFVFKVIRIC